MSSDRLSYLKELLSNDPSDSFLRYALAKEYEKIEQYDVALEVYRALLHDDPQYLGLYYHLGKLLEELDQTSEAVDIYNKGISIAKSQSDFHALSELHNAKTNAEIDI